MDCLIWVLTLLITVERILADTAQCVRQGIKDTKANKQKCAPIKDISFNLSVIQQAKCIAVAIKKPQALT